MPRPSLTARPPPAEATALRRGSGRRSAGQRVVVAAEPAVPADAGGCDQGGEPTARGAHGGGVAFIDRKTLSRSVFPPSAQCRMWWASAQVPGTVQPGKVQCRSRSHSARCWAEVKARRALPSSRICPVPARTPGRHRWRRSSRPMVTITVALAPARVTIEVATVARRHTPTRASPRRWSTVRGSLTPSTTLGAEAVLMAASTTARASGFSRSRYSGDPAADVVPTGQHGQPGVPVLDLRQHLPQPVLGQQRRPQPAHPGRPVHGAHRDQPGQHRLPRIQGRAPLGDPLGRRPGLRARDLPAGFGVGGDRVPARPGHGGQPVDHRQHHVQVRAGQPGTPGPAGRPAGRWQPTARRPAGRRSCPSPSP